MKFWTLQALLTAIVLMCLVGLANAQDTSADFSHKFELASTDIGIPVIGNKIIDSFPGGHDYWWTSQALYGGACIMYRAGEGAFTGNSHALYELEGDLVCDGLSCLVEVLFPPSKR